MKIAIDALGIHYVGGGRTATMTFLESLFELDSINQYLLFLSKPEPSLFNRSGNVTQRIVKFNNRFALRIWAQLYIPFLTRHYDILHFSKNLGVFGVRPKTVITIYDLTTLIRPELLPWTDVLYWKTIQKINLQNSTKIVAISENTAADLKNIYQLNPDKIRVIYPAIAKQFKPAPLDQIQRVYQKYRIPADYFLHVGRLDRKKNIPFLIEGFANFKKTSGSDVNLVLVGEEYPKSIDSLIGPTIHRFGLEDQVIFTGRVPDEDLPALYSGAIASVLTSLHEGFGLAPIESMACGTPLIAYNCGAIEEMAGGAALLINHLDVDLFAIAMQEISTDRERRQYHRDLGLARSAKFLGETTAAQTLDLYREISDQ